MSKVKVVGNAVVVESSIKLDDIKNAKKYRPESLVLKGGEDGKEEIFAISFGAKDEISKYGICFTGETRDEEKLATATVLLPEDVSDPAEYIADNYGGALINLHKLEEKLPTTVEEIAAERKALLESIKVQ